MRLGYDVAKVPEHEGAADEQSVWPFWFALTLSFFVMGLTLSPVLGAFGLFTVIVTTTGWVLENAQGSAHRVPSPSGDGPLYARSKLWWAALALVISEAALFAALFVVLGAYGVTSEPLSEHIAGLNTPSAVVATIVLWSSGFTGMVAGRRLEDGRVASMQRWLGVTLLFGTLFLAYQAYEYANLYGEGFTLQTGRDGAVFYGLTGLHGFHVFAGLFALVGVFFAVQRRAMDAGRRRDAFHAVMLYWHFVDAAWVFIYATLYLHLP